MLKRFGKSKKRIIELENDLKTMNGNVIFWKNQTKKNDQQIQTLTKDLENEKTEHESEVNSLRHKLEEQEMELNTLYKYWKLNEEPDRELIVKVHTDHKVHELEMQKMELEKKLEALNSTIRMQLMNDMNLTMRQQLQLMNSSFLQSPYQWR